MKKSDVANLTGGVETEDGRTLYGLDAEIYLKMKEKEDPVFERKIGEWVEDTLGEAIEDTQDLWNSLKNGVVLCRLLNKLRPGIIKKFNDSQKLNHLQERENIQLYLAACARLGMDSSNLFTIPDLHSRKSMSSVLQNLHALSKIPFGLSSSGGITYSAQSSKERKKFKWDLEYQSQPVYSEQLPDDPESRLKQTQKRLEDALQSIQKLSIVNQQLKEDLDESRRKLRQSGHRVPDESPRESSSSWWNSILSGWIWWSPNGVNSGSSQISSPKESSKVITKAEPPLFILKIQKMVDTYPILQGASFPILLTLISLKFLMILLPYVDRTQPQPSPLSSFTLIKFLQSLKYILLQYLLY